MKTAIKYTCCINFVLGDIYKTIIYRIYATNKANPSFRRMICQLSSKVEGDEPVDLPLPMFVQYVTMSTQPVKKLRIQPHGNATKSTRPFTATVPTVLEHVRVTARDNS